MKNIKCVIEARMGSKRLPKKTMKFLNKKFRLIDFVILNALSSRYFNLKNIFLLTSNNKNNQKLINYVKKKYKIKIIKGPEKNVYKRYDFFKKFKNIPLVRLTADNPLVDPYLTDRFVDYFLKYKTDYLTTRAMEHSKKWKAKSDFPKGISIEMFMSKKLFINEKKFNKEIQESPTWFFFNKKFKAKVSKFPSFDIYKNFTYRKTLSIDTKKDYLDVRQFIKDNSCKPGSNNIYKYLKKNIKKR